MFKNIWNITARLTETYKLYHRMMIYYKITQTNENDSFSLP